MPTHSLSTLGTLGGKPGTLIPSSGSISVSDLLFASWSGKLWPMTRTITIRYTRFRTCPNCEGRGDDGAAWRPFPCKRCEGRGKLITDVEVEDSASGKLPRSAYDFNAKGEVFLLDFDEEEDIEVIRLGNL